MIFFISMDTYASKCFLDDNQKKLSGFVSKDDDALIPLNQSGERDASWQQFSPLHRSIPTKDVCLGEHVWIRRLFPQDVTGLIPFYGDPNKMRLFGFGCTYDASWVYHRMKDKTDQQAQYPDHIKDVLFYIECEVFRSYTWSFFNHRGWSGTLQLFWNQADVLEIAYLGQGGTSEALGLLLQYIPDTTLMASAHPNNDPSIKILERYQFQKTAENIKKYDSIRHIYQRN